MEYLSDPFVRWFLASLLLTTVAVMWVVGECGE